MKKKPPHPNLQRVAKRMESGWGQLPQTVATDESKILHVVVAVADDKSVR